MSYESENPRTWKSICLKCNAARSLATPLSCCSPDSCICSRKLSYVNFIVYLYSICKIGPSVIGFYTVVVTLPLFYVVKL
jgi:hypothetical protein